MRENTLLTRLRGLFASADPAVTVGCGEDDCAHVSSPGPGLALSIDAFTEGTHFASGTPPAAVARKSLGAALSDLAASACQARWALVALCLGPGTAGNWAGEFAGEMERMAGEYGVAVIGGDTTASPLATTVTVAVIGSPLPGGPVLRRGARPGDVIAVTGRLGGSIHGRHLSPEPRLREIAWLMERCRPTAAMDISDGLALDLSRLCRESGVGAIVDAEAVPISSAARELARASGRTALEHALSDGEDFELLVAIPAEAWAGLAAAAANAPPDGLAPFSPIGTITAEAGLVLRGADGALSVLTPEGYEHQW